MSPEQQFTKYPNDIKAWREHLSTSQWTVLTVIHEKLADWDKTSDAVSLSQIEAKTTMGRTTIQEALAAMESPDGPLVVINRASRGIPIYSIRPCTMVKSTMVESTTLPESGMVASGGPVPILHTIPESTMVSTLTLPESGMVDAATLPESGTTTDVHTASKRVRKYSLLEGEQETGIPASLVPPTSKETLGEDGLVEKKNSVKVDLASVSLDGSPTSKPLFVSLKTGKIWEVGQDVACLTYELTITTGEAEVLLGYGKGAGQILAIARTSWKSLNKANSKVAYLVGILQNKGKANKPAEPTSTPLPRSAPPLPIADDPIDLGFGVDETSVDLGTGDFWHDEPAEQFVPATSMPVNQPAAAQAPAQALEVAANPAPATVSATQPIGDPYADMVAEAKAEVIVHEDKASRQAREAQDPQTGWEANQAACRAKLAVDMEQADLEAAAVVEEPATPGPAPEVSPSPAASPAPAVKIGWDPSYTDRVLAVVDYEPKTYGQLSVLSGVRGWTGDAVNELLKRGVVLQKLIGDSNVQHVYLAGKAPTAQNDRSDEWPN